MAEETLIQTFVILVVILGVQGLIWLKPRVRTEIQVERVEIKVPYEVVKIEKIPVPFVVKEPQVVEVEKPVIVEKEVRVEVPVRAKAQRRDPNGSVDWGFCEHGTPGNQLCSTCVNERRVKRG